MAGRWAVSRYGTAFSSPALIMGSALLALLSILGLMFTANQSAAALMVVCVGLGFAAVFPTTLAQAGTVFSDYSGTAFSVIFVMALSGGMSAPWLVGRIAQDHGIGAGFWVTVGSCGAIILLQGVIAVRRFRERSTPKN
jgi:fucose permease